MKEGKELGIAEGEAHARSEIARKMLEAGANPTFIKEITGMEI
jgi:hypothetical protein